VPCSVGFHRPCGAVAVEVIDALWGEYFEKKSDAEKERAKNKMHPKEILHR
jgi:hypothetical protein